METLHKKPIEPIESYDPLHRFLTRTLRFLPFTYGLFIFIADVLVDSWIGWRFNVFLSSSGTPGLLQDYTALVVDFVSNPILCGLYLWTMTGTTGLFQQLQLSSVFASESAVSDHVDQNRPVFRNRYVFYIILGASLIFSLFQLAAYNQWIPWKTVGGYLELSPSGSFARAPFWFLTFYGLAYGMFNVGVTIKVLSGLFRTKGIKVIPLHPDQCGGLGSISRYSIKIAYAIGSIGLVISAMTVYEFQQGTLLTKYPVMVAIGAYIVLAPLFFFGSLATAHDAMSEAKNTDLLGLAHRFDSIYSQLKKDAVGSDKDYENGIKQLEQSKKLYQIAEGFPVWPFDFGSLRRFFTIVTAPLLPALVSVAAGAMGRLLLP